MAVTGNFYNTLEFGGINSGDYGVYITGTGVYNAPARAVEMVSVPGRNGDVPIDMGHWDNIEVTYKCGLFGIDQSEMGSALMEFRNAIASQIGYQRLSDSYNPNEFRLGLFMAGLEFGAVSRNRAGEFELKFNCKPQRFLTDGEEMIDIGTDWSDLKTASGEVVTFEVEDDAAANYTQFKSLVADIEPVQDLNGYDHPWVGGAGKNLFHFTAGRNAYTWSDGCTLNQITAGDDSVTVNGTASANHPFAVPDASITLAAGTYTVSPSAVDKVGITVTNSTSGSTIGSSYGSGVTFTLEEQTTVTFGFVIVGGQTFNNQTVGFQIELGSTATAWTPYENICPISGWDSVTVADYAVNMLTEQTNEKRPCYIKGGTRIVASAKKNGTGNTYFYIYRKDGSRIDYWALSETAGGRVGRALTMAEDVYYVAFLGQSGTTLSERQVALAPTIDYSETLANVTTATFDETVYGGTVDLVSGVLTVDRAYVDLGTLTWSTSNTNIYGAVIVGMKTTSYGATANIICSNYVTAQTSYNDPYVSGDSMLWAYAGLTQIRIKDTRYTNPTAFKTAMNGVQLVYELAEPRTIQLDPQTINTLVGENNVWANSGDVTLEYGVRPGVLINPTQYESQPLLEIEGTGDVSLNDYVIAIDGGSVGEVELASERRVEPIMGGSYPSTITETIDMATTMSMLEDGDTFNISTLTASWLMGNTTSETYTITHQPTDGTASIETATSPRVSAVARFSQLEFAKGEANTFAEEFIVSGQSSHGTGSVTFSVDVDYDGSHTLTISYGVAIHPTITGVLRSGSYSDIGAIIGNSSKQTFSGQVIIDAETGDAYRIEDGTYISLNKYIQLGAELPTLRPGANVITYDDTITSLKIAPRWWRL